MQTTPIDDIHGAFLVDGDRFPDDRGWFQELYSTSRAYPHLIGRERQINLSCSKKGVVRGLHVGTFAKLCTCVKGCVYDVIADVRPDSRTYMKWFGVWLAAEARKQIFVPAGCAHGFFCQEDDSLFLYLQDGTYDPSADRHVNWKDPKLGIVWPRSQEYILSDKDKHAEML